MTRSDIPKGLEVQHVNGLTQGHYFRWTICKHVVLRDIVNKPVRTNGLGHNTTWTEFINYGPCPTCADAERRATETGRRIELPETPLNKPFTTSLSMSCMHMTFRDRNTRGEDPMFINSSNLTSTDNNGTDSQTEGWCELCWFKKTPPYEK